LVDTQKEEIMGVQVTKKRRKRRAFTDEYRAEVVRLVETSGKSISQIADDLDLTESAVRNWVKAAQEGSASKAENQQPDLESENRDLRKRIKVLEMEREILKKAAAFFAKENS
jgi:transposase-like protein